MRSWPVFIAVLLVAVGAARGARGQNDVPPIGYTLMVSPPQARALSIAIGSGEQDLDAPELVRGWRCHVSGERDSRRSSAVFVSRTLWCSAAHTETATVACCDDPDCADEERTDAAHVALSTGDVSPTNVTLTCQSPVRRMRRPLRPGPPLPPEWRRLLDELDL